MTEHANDAGAILALYADGPAQLTDVLTGFTESELNLALTTGSWTIRQIVHHIADGDDINALFQRRCDDPGRYHFHTRAGRQDGMDVKFGSQCFQIRSLQD